METRPPESPAARPAAVAALGLAAGLAVLGAVFRSFGLPWGDFAKFLLGLGLGVYVPGAALVGFLKIEASRLERLTLVLVLGMTSTTLLFRIAAILRLEPALWAWLAGCAIVFAARLVKRPPRPASFGFRIRPAGAGLAAVALLVFGLLHADNYRNGLALPDGSLRLLMHYYDGFNRSALVGELSHTIPPQMPFAAGLPVSYHYDMNLFAAMFHRFLGIGIFDLLLRLTITFFFALVLMSAYAFVRAWKRSDGAALLGTFLVVFGGGGLAWLFGLAFGYQGLWGKLFYSFYLIDLASVNPFLPCLAVLFTGLLCLHRYLETRRAAWLWPAGFLLAAVTGYKMTFAVPILIALGAVALVFLARRRSAAPLWAALFAGALTAPLLLAAFLLNTRGPAFTLKIAFSDWIVFPLSDLKLQGLGKAWLEFTKPSGLGAPQLLAAAAAIGIFLAGSLGAGLFWIPSLAKEAWAAKRGKAVDAFLFGLFAAGLGLFFFANPYLGARTRNWIMVDIFKLGTIALLLLWAGRLAPRLARLKPAVRALAVAGVLALGLPNAAQFFWAKVRFPDPMVLDKAFVAACEYLKRETDPESVVLHSRRVVHACYVSERRVVLDASPHSYLSFNLEPEQVEERAADIDRFFADPRAAGDVLDKYGVTHVWASKKEDPGSWDSVADARIECFSEPAGGGGGTPVRTHALDLVYWNFRVALYRVTRTERSDLRDGRGERRKGNANRSLLRVDLKTDRSYFPSDSSGIFMPHRRLGPAALIALSLVLPAACSRPRPGRAYDFEAEWTFRESRQGTVRIVTTTAGSIWRGKARLAESLRLGEGLAGEPYLFGRIGGLAAWGDRLFVLDEQVPALRMYDGRGRYLRDLGRKGEGPGEYVAPSGLAAHPRDGRLFVQDAGRGKVLVYSPAGDYLETWGIPAWSWGLGMVAADDGALYIDEPVLDPAAGVFNTGIRMVGYGPGGPTGKSIKIPRPDFVPAEMVYMRRGPATASCDVPFSPRAHWALAPSGAMIHGIATDFRFDIDGAAGGTVRAAIGLEPAPVDPAEAEWHRRALTAAARSVTPGWTWAGPPIPVRKPAFREFLPDQSGRIWVRRQGPGTRLSGRPETVKSFRDYYESPLWTDRILADVFDESGGFLGEIALPEGFRFSPPPYIRDDRVLAVVRDAEGYDRVVLYRLATAGLSRGPASDTWP